MKLSVLYSLIALVYAQSVQITNPVASSQVKADDVLQIDWIKSQSSFIPVTIDLGLVNGPDSNLVQVVSIGTAIDVAAGKFSWTVPASIPNDNNGFAIRVIAKDVAGKTEYNFSARFKIVGLSVATTASSAVSPTATQTAGQTKDVETSPCSEPSDVKGTQTASPPVSSPSEGPNNITAIDPAAVGYSVDSSSSQTQVSQLILSVVVALMMLY